MDRTADSHSIPVPQPGLSQEELEDEGGDELPERLAMSVINPCPTSALPAAAADAAWDNAPVYSIQPVPPEQEVV